MADNIPTTLGLTAHELYLAVANATATACNVALYLARRLGSAMAYGYARSRALVVEAPDEREIALDLAEQGRPRSTGVSSALTRAYRRGT